MFLNLLPIVHYGDTHQATGDDDVLGVGYVRVLGIEIGTENSVISTL